MHEDDIVGRMFPPYPSPTHEDVSGTSEYVTCHGRKSFADIIKVIHLKIGKLYWIFCLGPIYPHEPLKANDCLHLEFRKIG